LDIDDIQALREIAAETGTEMTAPLSRL